MISSICCCSQGEIVSLGQEAEASIDMQLEQGGWDAVSGDNSSGGGWWKCGVGSVHLFYVLRSDSGGGLGLLLHSVSLFFFFLIGWDIWVSMACG